MSPFDMLCEKSSASLRHSSLCLIFRHVCLAAFLRLLSFAFAFFPPYLSIYLVVVPLLLQEQDKQGNEIVSVVHRVLYFFLGCIKFRV